jgi:predicted enzyme related to lactoylglutathione lyase
MAASAVLYVKDLQSMRAFYETCFAMCPQHAGERFCVLASSDWELSLVRVADHLAAAIVIAAPPIRREDSPIKLAFDVADLDRVGSLVVAAGGQIDPTDAIWKYRGHLHLDCLDPEGNVLQLRQPTRT